MFSLKQVEALYWIARLGTFERAASKLNTTQSAISKRIQELEGVAGVALFDRSRRSARLTEKGEQLLALAQEMLALQQRVVRLKDGPEIPVRRLRLGITELTALTWLPRLVAALRARYPKITIETEVDMSRDLYDRLQEDRLDLIIIPESFSDRHVTAVPLATNRNVWMGSPKLVRQRRRLSVAELAEHTILIQGSRSGSGLWVSNWLKSEGVTPPRLFSSDSLIALLGLAVAGLGVTYLPLQCFRPLVSEGKLRIIPTSPELPDIPYAALYRNDRPTAFTASVAELAMNTCDFSRQLQG
ncbi:MAG: LysR family transcriptional regulator [Bradyrhizobium sp.]